MFTSRLRGITNLIRPATLTLPDINGRLLHTTIVVKAGLNKPRINNQFSEPKKWSKYNDKIFPVQSPEEQRRLAYVCHMKSNFKYSPKKMWYVASFVRGMSVDEALRQLEYVNKKGAAVVRETILEAQDLAVKEHNVEFKSNLWVAESFVGKGFTMKGMRRHARGRFGIIHYRYCHYFVRLEEGQPPPKDKYYWREPTDGESLLKNWLDAMRNRKIVSSL